MRITRDFPLSTGATIFYHAEDVRKERTGIHAKVIITLDKTLLSWTNFNVERDEDRVRLANSAWKSLGDVDREAWTQYQMKHGLDLFCAFLWDGVIGKIDQSRMAGAGGTVAQDWLIEPYVLKGGGTILFSPPGRGKSYTAMLMAVSCDAGTDVVFPGVTQPRKGLYINIERSKESMQRRLYQVNSALGLEPERPLAFLNARGKSLNDVIDAAEAYVTKEGIEVVYLDSISRAGFGDLNENSPVNRIIDALNGLCETWFALAHTPRADESHLYGSVHFDAGMDIGLQMLSETKNDGYTLGVGLKVTKANDSRKPDRPFFFALEFGELGLQSVRPARHGEFAAIASTSMKPEDKALEYLLSIGEGTAEEISAEIGKHRSDVSRMLTADGRFLARKAGRVVFWSVKVQE